MSKGTVILIGFVLFVMFVLVTTQCFILDRKISDLAISIHQLRLDTDDWSAAMSSDLNFKAGRAP